MKSLVIIPARGGSKGLVEKNIRPINGMPLIGWTIKSALQAFDKDDIFVSTDDQNIVNVAERFGLGVPFLRPSNLAQDNSPTIDCVLHAIEAFEEIGKHYDSVVLLEPTSPLRKSSDLGNAMNLFEENWSDYDSMTSLGKIHLENPEIVKTIKDSKIVSLVSNKKILRRQDYLDYYFPYGVIYAAKTSFILKNKIFYNDDSLPYFIERWQNFEIDDEIDFACVETILKMKEKYII